MSLVQLASGEIGIRRRRELITWQTLWTSSMVEGVTERIYHEFFDFRGIAEL